MPDFLRNRVRSWLPSGMRRAWRNLKLLFTADMEFTLQRMEFDEKNFQGLAALELKERCPALTVPQECRSEINRHEFKVYSQNGEDGILAYLFSRVGAPHRTFVEFGVSNGRECNSANLALNFGWTGLMIEADPRIHRKARHFYDVMLNGPEAERLDILRAFVTAENINQLISGAGIAGEIDLLSVDIDSNDYWVWKAINVIHPRVVVVEYNASLGNDRPLTVKYNPHFSRYDTHWFYYGVSLPAAVKLGKEKGYTFVGCDSRGVNAFFVRQEIASQHGLQAVTTEAAFYPQARRSIKLTTEQQFDLIKHLPLVEV